MGGWVVVGKAPSQITVEGHAVQERLEWVVVLDHFLTERCLFVMVQPGRVTWWVGPVRLVVDDQEAGAVQA